jgi:hypothetical protein
MAKFRLLKVIAQGSGAVPALKLQPKLDNVTNVGQPLTVNCPGQKNSTDAAQAPLNGGDHSLALHNVQNSAVYKSTGSISPIQVGSKTVSLVPKPYSNITLKVVYAVESNVFLLTRDYLGILTNLVLAFISGVVVASVQYFSSLIFLLTHPILRLLGRGKASEIDQLMDEIEDESVEQSEKVKVDPVDPEASPEELLDKTNK